MAGAIDFTAANGKLGEAPSLHDLDDSNRYETILRIFGSALEPYSTTKRHTFFGFGADTRAQDEAGSQMRNPFAETAIADAENCFPINGVAEEPASLGIENLIANYKDVLGKVSASGPALLAPTLRTI